MNNDVTGVTARSPRYPIVYWAAGIGLLLFIFEIYILFNWVTGPNFTTVPYGPSEPPQWMKTGMEVGQVLAATGTIYVFYLWTLRPWFRDREVTFWGLMVPILFLTSIYDPTGSYFHNWYTYNAYLLNFGTPLPGGLPGWQSFAEPGAMNAFPIILLPCLYVLVFIFFIWSGALFMGWLRNRFPLMPPGLMAFCILLFIIFDIIVEGHIFMRLGWYTESGWGINQGEYYQLPWRNIILAALMWTMCASLWFFRDDRGQTIVEKGLEKFRANSAKHITLRFFALFAAIQIILMTFYQVPMAFHAKYFPGHWPDVVSNETYWNNHICGYDTPRPCPYREGNLIGNKIID